MSRPFTDKERAILQAIARNAENSAALLAQIETAEYVAPWFEGSQSFDIHTDPAAPRWWSGRDIGSGRQIGPGNSVRVDAHRPDSDSNYIGEVFLWVINGLLEALEYSWVTDVMPAELPRLDQLVAHDTKVIPSPSWR